MQQFSLEQAKTLLRVQAALRPEVFFGKEKLIEAALVKAWEAMA